MKSNFQVGRTVFGALTFAAATLLAPLALSAQIADAPPPPERECRCVDASGQEIENCSCIRAPRMPFETISIARGFMRRAQIGVNITYDQTGDADGRGVRIEDVMDGSPAEEGGLRAGDLVTHVDGQSVLEPLDDDEWEADLDSDGSIPVQRFVRIVGALEPGEPAEFRVLRDGESRTLTIEPEESELAFFGGADAPNVAFFRGDEGSFDVRIAPMVERLREMEMRLGEEGIRLRELREGELESRLRMDEETRERLRDRMAENEVRVRGQMLELRERMADREGRSAAPRVWVNGEDGEGMVRFFGEGDFAFSGDPCMVRTDREDGLAIIVNGSNCTDGVELVDLNPGLGSYFGTSEGVLVTEVHDGSALGLQAGDVLLSIDGRAIEDRAEAARVLRSYDLDDEIRLRVRRDDREIEVLGRRRAPN